MPLVSSGARRARRGLAPLWWGLALLAALLAAAAAFSRGVSGEGVAASFGAADPGALDPALVAAPDASAARAAPRQVALALHRLQGGGGRALVSSGIPLPPGAVTADQIAWVAVVVGDSQPAQRVRALHTRHRDGSLRAVLVQFHAELSGPRSVPARLVIGPRRAAAALPGDAAAPGSPEAVALPTDPTYLVATDVVGPTRTVVETRLMGGAYARYEEDFRTFSEKLWASEGPKWEGNYYDRALIYYAWWARTGDPLYWRRATESALTYRRDYLEANKADPYKSSPHWAQLGGLAVHYQLTGDEGSRKAVVRVADILNGFNPSYMTRAIGESRIAARLVQSALLAWRLMPPGSPLPEGAERADWAQRLDRHLAAVFAWQLPDGSYPADGQVCGGQLNYMVGMLDDALIQVYGEYRQDPRIVDAVRRAGDYMWRTQWRGDAQAFQYASVMCPKNEQGFGVGGPDPAPDLNGLIATTYAWLGARASDPAERGTYRQRTDAVLAGGVAKAWLSGSKQFNEHYSASYRALGYR
ncbi:hypothetical protein [Roseisolibacter sp. H3M3-2]|uniref:hypothetical protein n=1 Tax=Roseisolibacter sp. H3M3-2 TaxID=3031323 RepID=UPI0023DA5795|nr:hypothetical protein [Roseisolibacter sp. H3M3-2]